jgi:hypothetical protein
MEKWYFNKSFHAWQQQCMNFPVFSCSGGKERKTYSPTLREEQRLKVSENKVWAEESSDWEMEKVHFPK